MKMKNLLSQPLRRRALALTLAASLGGIAAAPASALNSDAYSAQARAALGHLLKLQEACMTSPVVFCPSSVPSLRVFSPFGSNGTMRKLWDAM